MVRRGLCTGRPPASDSCSGRDQLSCQSLHDTTITITITTTNNNNNTNYNMGIEYSTEDHQDIPVTGAPKSLEVIKWSGKYVKKDIVLLRLRENGLNYRLYNTNNRQRVWKLLKLFSALLTLTESLTSRSSPPS